MGKKNLADNPAVIARAEAVMKRMDDEELAREATKIVDEGIMTEDDVQRLAEYAAKIDTQNIVPNSPLGTLPTYAPCIRHVGPGSEDYEFAGCIKYEGKVCCDPNCKKNEKPAEKVIVPVEATLDHILQELAQLESQCGSASTIEHALHKAAEFVRLAKIDYKYL